MADRIINNLDVIGGSITMSGGTVTGLPLPTAPTEAASMAYVDSVAPASLSSGAGTESLIIDGAGPTLSVRAISAGTGVTLTGTSPAAVTVGITAGGTPVFSIASSTIQYNSSHPSFALTNDFVVCSSSLDDSGVAGDTRMFFDQSLGAVRAGTVTGTEWDAASRGDTSVAFGLNTISSANQSVVCGGSGNTANATQATVVGGLSNTASSLRSFVGGGNDNISGNTDAGVCCGNTNSAGGARSFVGAGQNNTSGTTDSVVVGGNTNTTSGIRSFVGGGRVNTAGGSDSVICGGDSNSAPNLRTFVGGGTNNVASATDATSVAGNANTAGGLRSFVGGGVSNRTSATEAAVCAGNANTASGIGAFVGGGNTNRAGGTEAMIPGGGSNIADGAQSFAAGESADDNSNSNTFVWSDSNGLTATAATADSWWVGCAGGATFYSNALHTTGVAMATGSNAWAGVSDRNMKENLIELHSEDVLHRLRELPIYQYNFIGQPADMIYRSPVAQDWHTLFPSGKDPLRIDTTDLDGISLAAVKGLLDIVEQQSDEIDALKARVEGLEKA